MGELAGELARRLGAEPSLTRRAAELWPRIAGPVLAAHVVVSGVRGGTVHLVADGPAWAAQARYRSGELLAALTPTGDAPGKSALSARVTVRPASGGSGRASAGPRGDEHH